MSTYMTLQSAWIIESFMTKVTRIRFLACMNEFMSFHCTGIIELFVTKFTNCVKCSGDDISRLEMSRIDLRRLKMPWTNLSRTKVSRLKNLSNSDFGCEFFKTFLNKCKQSSLCPLWYGKVIIYVTVKPSNLAIYIPSICGPSNLQLVVQST